jgi:radical SAM superfamily enzyme YgiQ (UPF0313 family)
MAAGRCNVLLIYPKFQAESFWTLRETCEAVSARYPTAPLGLITVAALLPQQWDFRLVNCNTAALTDGDLDWADLVMTGGMITQQRETLDLIDLCRRHGKRVVVGGPDVTSTPHFYDSADFRVVGEAELVIDDFVAAWRSGAAGGMFVAEKFKADVTRTPVPRFDLLKFSDYLCVGVQYSRGCPFTCEFCDIIELYGRVPRAKTTAQMLAELDALYALGYRGHLDFVDDNLIGNKKALKQFLPALIAWQRAHGYPFELSTEASINLSDDDHLLLLMRDANFFMIFVGIESPDADTLVATQKKQNTRRSLADSVHKIYGAGMFVVAGFILGFDSEKGSIADPMTECIEATSIPACMIGLLYALPNTQLTRRLSRERRLYQREARRGGDQCTEGLNFATARARRDILADYLQVLERAYEPRAYFGRVRRVGRMLRQGLGQMPSPLPAAEDPQAADHGKPARPGSLPPGAFHWAAQLARHVVIRRPAYLWQIVLTIYDCARHNPAGLRAVLTMVAMYLHLGPFTHSVADHLRREIAAIDSDGWTAPPLAPDANPDAEADTAPSLAPGHSVAARVA